MPTIGFHSSMSDSTASSLIEKVKAHDADAWSRLVKLYGPLVDFWIRRAGLQEADSGDVFQEVFAAVARGIESFQRHRVGDTFRGWLRVITRTKVADHFRRGQSQPIGLGGSDAHQQFQQIPDIELDQDSGSAEMDALHQLRLRGLELIRMEFEERTWQMFWRSAIDEQPTREVAEAFGVTQSAVRLAKSRVLRRLREELGDADMK